MLFCRETVCVPLQYHKYLLTLVVFLFLNKAAYKRLDRCRWQGRWQGAGGKVQQWQGTEGTPSGLCW